VGKHKGGMIP